MGGAEYEERKKNILELIVETYIATASPVGSEMIARKLRSSLSPATIRTVMAELEDEGFLEQPHTSAGRTPTDRGYRFYVDVVIGTRHVPPDRLRQIEASIEPQEMELDVLLDRAGSVLSELTQQAALVLAPTVKHSTVKQVELVPLGVHKLLCVLIANDEMIASHVVEVQEPMSREEATALARFMTMELGGLSVRALLESLERRMVAESDALYQFVKRSLEILQHALSTEPEERLLVEGASFVVSQPEFSRDPRKAHALLKGLDDEEPLVEQVRESISRDGVHTRIGHEIRVPGLEECSYVATAFPIGGGVSGGVGVLGPRRMDYASVASLVDGMRQCLTTVLSRWMG